MTDTPFNIRLINMMFRAAHSALEHAAVGATHHSWSTYIAGAQDALGSLRNLLETHAEVYPNAQPIKSFVVRTGADLTGRELPEDFAWRILRANCYAALEWVRLGEFRGSDDYLPEWPLLIEKPLLSLAAAIHAYDAAINALPNESPAAQSIAAFVVRQQILYEREKTGNPVYPSKPPKELKLPRTRKGSGFVAEIRARHADTEKYFATEFLHWAPKPDAPNQSTPLPHALTQ